jgi:hypothetical protein
MRKPNEIASSAKHSNAASTPDCESVKNYLNLLPKSECHDEYHQKDGKRNALSVNGNATTIDKIDASGNKTNGANESEFKDSTVQQGNDLVSNHSNQENTVTTNNGITGIFGTGHTIYNYACPPEIIELISKLSKKGGLL